MPSMPANFNLLVVDDEPNVIQSIRRCLRKEPYHLFPAHSGEEGLNILKQEEVGVILSDARMPHMDGITFLESSMALQPESVRLLLTGYASMENAKDAVNRSRIYGYLTKPWIDEELKESLARAFAHYQLKAENRQLQNEIRHQNLQLKDLNKNLESLVKKRTQELEDAVKEGVKMLALAAEAKDDDTGEHVVRIKEMVYQICVELGLSHAEAEEISFFSMMHDVGKIHIPDAILRKPGPLTASEFEVMKTHTTAGHTILGRSPFYQIARDIAIGHHERWDGTGYPNGLRGDDIPLAARIVTVADVYDALIHKRVYKPAWPREEALEELRRQAGIQFDPDVVEAFMQLYSN